MDPYLSYSDVEKKDSQPGTCGTVIVQVHHPISGTPILRGLHHIDLPGAAADGRLGGRSTCREVSLCAIGCRFKRILLSISGMETFASSLEVAALVFIVEAQA